MDSQMLKQIVPVLGGLRYKGQNGKVGVIGGSFEYTGAPYYVAMSIIKGGGDIAHIFCSQQSSIPIKSYSPEPIVHPLLTNTDEQSYTEEQIDTNTQKLIKWNETLHSLVIGSGLGRNKTVGRQIQQVLSSITQPTVLDADSLWFLENETYQQIVRSKSNLLVLTPNAAELKRLNSIFGWQQNATNHTLEQDVKDIFQELDIEHPLVQNAVFLSKQLNNVTILQKGVVDIITDGKQAFIVNFQGSLKRCGGQGDLLSGLTGLYCFWAFQQKQPLWYGCVSASIILRRAAKKAYEKHLYSLSALDILGEIGPSFQETFFSKL